MLYLTVNNGNEKARALYSRLGYRLASERAVRTKFLIANEPVSDALLVVPMVTQGVVADLTANCYDSIDMSPSGRPSGTDSCNYFRHGTLSVHLLP